MAVYTHLTQNDVGQLLKHYNLGTCISYQGITSGVENSNYMLVTTTGKFILTIYEKRVVKADLPFYLELMNHLQQRQIPVPSPLATTDGTWLSEIHHKPCAIVSFLEGKSALQLSNSHLSELGSHMARMHLASSNFSQSLENRFSLTSWFALFVQIKDYLHTIKPGLSQEIEQHLQHLQTHWPQQLPKGVIHGDLFPDNVFFQGHKLSGMIDFYFACSDFLMYDIAICLNAWCFETGGDFNITKAKLLLTHYHQIRPLSEDELNALPILASGAAMRFLLTRLYDWLHQNKDAIVIPKNPLEYLSRLRFHHNIVSHTEYGL